jgi:sugar lactone lactonase YvrE
MDILKGVSARYVSGKKLLSIIVVASLLAMSLVYVNAQSSFSEEKYIPLASWGKAGTEAGQFNKPKSVTVDNRGFVYVVDTGNARVQKFTDAGKFIAQIGSAGEGNGQFNTPYGIAINSRGDIYVTDQVKNNVQVFTSEGNFTSSWGGMGNRAGQFKNPLGIAIDTNDNVYVVDNGNKRVQKFNINGTFILQWGQYGSGDGQFADPYSITTDIYGMVYVVDAGSGRVQKFLSDGKFMESWGNGSKIRLSAEPTAIVSDQGGNLYVADGRNNLIQKYNIAGTLIEQLSDTRQNFPISGVAVDALGYIYVADYAGNRIQKFGTISSTWPTLQGTMGVINKQLSTLIQGSSSETILLPSSVHGVLVTSGEGADVFGDPIALGDLPSIAPGNSAKITGIIVQNKDSAADHKIRIQLGYEDKKGDFAIRQDIKVVLHAKGELGDAATLTLPEPFFVPANQSSSGGTNLIVKVAADSPRVLVEVSVSGILNP